jgi:predicted nucleic acid-binding protein
VVKKLVFVDTGVLIAAARGTDEAAQRAMQILDDPDSSFASSIFVRLEALPKPLYHKKRDEIAFYEAFFEAVSAWAEPGSELTQNAYDEAARVGLSAMDALHVSAAAAVGADALVTTEKLTNPIHRATLVRVQTIAP